MKKYLNYMDILNLNSDNKNIRENLYSLRTHLTIDHPHYTYKNNKLKLNNRSPEFFIKKYTNLSSLYIGSHIQNFQFLGLVNLKNFKKIKVFFF